LFVLGHTVLGSQLVQLLRRQLPLGWLVLGTLLPDLIDKPLYYGLVFATGRDGAELGLISGTRTIGHTGLLLAALAAAAAIARSTRLAAVAWGSASHLALDLLTDLVRQPREGPSGIHAVLFPLLGPHFPISRLSVTDHLLTVRDWSIAVSEALGAAVLIWLLVRRWKRRRRGHVAAPPDGVAS